MREKGIPLEKAKKEGEDEEGRTHDNDGSPPRVLQEHGLEREAHVA